MKLYLVRVETDKYDMRVVVVDESVKLAMDSAIKHLNFLKDVEFSMDEITSVNISECNMSYSQIIDSHVRFLGVKGHD